MTELMWANSGDSHILEPPELWRERMPRGLGERMPRAERIDTDREVIHIDGQSFERRTPAVVREGEFAGLTFEQLESRPPGSWDVDLRLTDLDAEGIWGEVVYPSLGLWNGLIHDDELYREGVRVLNDWQRETILAVTPRLIPTAALSILSVDDAVDETWRCVELGFQAIQLPTWPTEQVPNFNRSYWEPLWTAAEQAGMVVAFHIGSDARPPGEGNVVFRGPGGAVLNYVETTYGGQRVASMLVTSGVLDRHPGLRVLISEGGASWVPFIADRMDEGYRQHGMFVQPKLSRLPGEILYDQVYTSFQHDRSAVQAYEAMGYRNILWGSDYPHIEGTFGHTQKTLHELFDSADPATTERITRGAFLELFPSVGVPPA